MLAAGQNVDRIEDMLDQLADFRRYMYANAPSLINYNIARIEGERVDGACRIHRQFAGELADEQEATDALVALGAQHLLHVRTAILNGRLHRYTGLPVQTAATTTVPSPIKVAA